jgi:hypothetical protein
MGKRTYYDSVIKASSPEGKKHWETLRDNPTVRGKETRNSSLVELDQPSEELESVFSRKKGSFDPEEEQKKETEAYLLIQDSKGISKEGKKKYLELLKKRMRTA